MSAPVIVILGCTASGKGTLARSLAAALGGEIVSLDSMKVYRGMDIGTAKPPLAARAAVPHHLIDVVDPWEPFSVARFVELADAAVAEIHARGRPVVAVGGTMLYFKCWYAGLFEGPAADPEFRAELRRRAEQEGLDRLHAELAAVDPAAAARIHRNDLRRIERALEVFHLTGRRISELQQQWTDDSGENKAPALSSPPEAPASSAPRRADWRWLLLGLEREREETNRRINLRVKRMVAAGLVEEARRIWSDPRGVGPQAGQAVGYAELLAHFDLAAGRLVPGQAGYSSAARELDHALEQIKIHSRRLAKQQRTWLKRLRDVRWLDARGIEDTATLLPQALAALNPLVP